MAGTGTPVECYQGRAGRFLQITDNLVPLITDALISGSDLSGNSVGEGGTTESRQSRLRRQRRAFMHAIIAGRFRMIYRAARLPTIGSIECDFCLDGRMRHGGRTGPKC